MILNLPAALFGPLAANHSKRQASLSSLRNGWAAEPSTLAYGSLWGSAGGVE